MENQNKKKEVKSQPTLSPFRNLANYKSMHRDSVEKKGRLAEFLAAPTLTAARRIAFR